MRQWAQIRGASAGLANLLAGGGSGASIRDLQHLAEVEEISIGFTRPDGSTGSTPVWVGQAGEAIFGRSVAGAAAGTGGWGPTPTARSATEPIHPTRCAPRPVQDADTVAAVTGADAAKDGDSL